MKGRKTGGRTKGTPNKTTADVREAIAAFATNNVVKLEGWLTRVARKNPAKAADILLRAMEYHIPKLGRSEITGKDGGPLDIAHQNQHEHAKAGLLGPESQKTAIAREVLFTLAQLKDLESRHPEALEEALRMVPKQSAR